MSESTTDNSDILQMLTQEFWDERYGSADSIWSGAANPQLVAQASSLTPGTAIDIGSGEGADVIWLAERGWQVTGLDVSQVALDRAAANARTAGVADRCGWERADILTWQPSTTYDLVSSQFMQLPPTEMASLVQRLASAVNVGGSLLIVGHHPVDLEGMEPSFRHRMVFTAEDITAQLTQEWEIIFAGSRQRTRTDPEGNEVMITDAVLHARRL